MRECAPTVELFLTPRISHETAPPLNGLALVRETNGTNGLRAKVVEAQLHLSLGFSWEARSSS